MHSTLTTPAMRRSMRAHGIPPAAPAPRRSLPPAPARRSTGKRGRPSCAERVSPSVRAAAPFPELVELNAEQLISFLRRSVSDPLLMRQAYAFETANFHRKSVLEELERRLERRGWPLGGPDHEPLPGYDQLDELALLQAIAALTPDQAATVYAWEHYRLRRPTVLRAAERLCDRQGKELVLASAPPRRPRLREPFPGFDALSSAPAARQRVRETLAARSRDELADAVEYESATKNRVIMQRALRAALRAKGEKL